MNFVKYFCSLSLCLFFSTFSFALPTDDNSARATSYSSRIRQAKSDYSTLRHSIKEGVPCSCEGFDLEGRDLSGLDLRGFDFSGANCRKVNFSRSLLSHVSFKGAVATKANFTGADLKKSDFTDATVNGAKFKGSRLDGIMAPSKEKAKGTVFDRKIIPKQLARHVQQQKNPNDLRIARKGPPAAEFERRSEKRRNPLFQEGLPRTLDLHGDRSPKSSLTLLRQFITHSYSLDRPQVEVVTGRGLHNQSGTMGVLWNKVGNELRGNLRGYVKDAVSKNRGGAYEVTLRGRITKGMRKKLGAKKRIKEKKKNRRRIIEVTTFYPKSISFAQHPMRELAPAPKGGASVRKEVDSSEYLKQAFAEIFSASSLSQKAPRKAKARREAEEKKAPKRQPKKPVRHGVSKVVRPQSERKLYSTVVRAVATSSTTQKPLQGREGKQKENEASAQASSKAAEKKSAKRQPKKPVRTSPMAQKPLQGAESRTKKAIPPKISAAQKVKRSASKSNPPKATQKKQSPAGKKGAVKPKR